jgi:hypothetical protein
MTDLAAITGFIERNLDEDEGVATQAALAAGTTDGTPDPRWTVFHGSVGASGGVVATGIEDIDEAAGAHIARWDPARVLAEVAAKRRRLDLHQAVAVPYDDRHGSQGIDWGCRECSRDEPGSWPCDTILTDAAPYAGRDGWNDAWAL